MTLLKAGQGRDSSSIHHDAGELWLLVTVVGAILGLAFGLGAVLS